VLLKSEQTVKNNCVTGVNSHGKQLHTGSGVGVFLDGLSAPRRRRRRNESRIDFLKLLKRVIAPSIADAL
jgi:hypothetical protein